MDAIMRVIGWPLGWIMWLMYRLVSNYGIALLLFTLVTKILMLPLAVKQQQSTIKQQMIQPKMKEIQDKYKNNPAKANEEIQALYARENYSMTAGCLPALIQLPILFGLLDVIYKPLTHLVRLGADSVTILADIVTANAVTANGPAFTNYTKELVILGSMKAHPEWFAGVSAEIVGSATSLNLEFLGLDLTAIPGSVIKMLNPLTWGNPLILIPILSGLTALAVSLLTTKYSAVETAGSMKAMMLTMPLMSLIFTFSFPAGAGLYWIFGNLFAAIQAMILNKFWNPKELAEKLKLEEEERRQAERQEKIEAKKRAKELGVNTDDESLSQKERDRRKLMEARRRSAEKYGEIFVEDEDQK